MTNAERQKRYREKRNENVTQDTKTVTPVTRLVIAELPMEQRDYLYRLLHTTK